MTGTGVKAVVRAARGGLGGRRLQAVVIGLVVLACTAASVLALGMLVDTRNPFDQAFSQQNGAHLTVSVPAADGSAAVRASGATAVAGPFPEQHVEVNVTVPGIAGTASVPVDLVGRSAPGGPVDDLVLKQGHWPLTSGQIVWSENGPLNNVLHTGSTVTLAGGRTLTVVGIANSVTATADAWVLPAVVPDAQSAQVMYRFASAGTAGAIAADIAAVRHVLPAGALGSTTSYLDVRLNERDNNAVWVPFIVTFGIIALVMSVLIVVNVVSGAVVAGTTRIGVLKSIGFTPVQVVCAYLLQVVVPALAGCVAGAFCGNLLATPLLGRNATVYHVGTLTLPLWVSVTVPLLVLCVTAVAGLLPASRAGRMSAVQAIATGRAPRVLRGYRVLRLLGRLRGVPRPVTIGLAAPFSRPARTAVTAAAVLFGVMAVTFGAGLSVSMDRVNNDIRRADTSPVRIMALPPASPGAALGKKEITLIDGPPSMSAVQQQAVVSAVRSSPDTLHYVAETDTTITGAGLPGPLQVTAFGGDATWAGYALISGRWYSGPDEVVANTFFLTATGTSVGSSYTLSSGGRSETVKIVGEVFLPDRDLEMVMSAATLSAVHPSGPTGYAVAVRSGVDPQSYANTLSAQLRGIAAADAKSSAGADFVAVISLVALLTLLLIAVAGLGVLNTVVLQLRERVHDLGVFKSVGMTPRQTIAMVVCSVSVIGVLGGVIAVPLGVWLHHGVLPVMANAASTGLPPSAVAVYPLWMLILLALAGLLIAIAGALGPAGWAARTRTAFALRAE